MDFEIDLRKPCDGHFVNIYKSLVWHYDSYKEANADVENIIKEGDRLEQATMQKL